jgi:hypothetical protein
MKQSGRADGYAAAGNCDATVQLYNLLAPRTVSGEIILTASSYIKSGLFWSRSFEKKRTWCAEH